MDESIVTIVAILGLILIVVVLVFANSLTGNVSNSGYGIGKVYGGGAKARTHENALWQQEFLRKTAEAQNHLFNNKEDWDCTFGKEAERSPYPCVFDDELQRYCCVVDKKFENPLYS